MLYILAKEMIFSKRRKSKNYDFSIVKYNNALPTASTETINDYVSDSRVHIYTCIMIQCGITKFVSIFT